MHSLLHARLNDAIPISLIDANHTAGSGHQQPDPTAETGATNSDGTEHRIEDGYCTVVYWTVGDQQGRVRHGDFGVGGISRNRQDGTHGPRTLNHGRFPKSHLNRLGLGFRTLPHPGSSAITRQPLTSHLHIPPSTPIMAPLQINITGRIFTPSTTRPDGHGGGLTIADGRSEVVS
jgi:hypothetical protein